MSHQHAVVWLDHSQAHILQFNAEDSASETIKLHGTHRHAHDKAAHSLTGTAPEDARYFDDITGALKEFAEILIVGPGMEKLAYMKHLLKHDHGVADKVYSVETVDHPSDGQLLAYARRYFDRADRMR